MYVLIQFCLILTSFVFVGVNAQEYKFVEQKDGITLYSKIDQTSGQEWTKLVAEIDATRDEVTSFTGDISNLTDWVYACDKVELIDKSSNETIYYLVTDMPYPMTDRDLIIRKIVTTDVNKGITTSISENYTDIEKSSSLVRIPRFETIWIFEQLPNGNTKVTYEVSADPGGSIPNWVKDRFGYYGPLKSMENLIHKFQS